MAGVIYSQQLYNNGPITPGGAVLYTVPASTTVVVTNVDGLWDPTAGNESLYVVLKQALVVYVVASVAGNLRFTWAGRQVLLPGDQITANASAGPLYMGITGYVLGP